MSSIIRKGLNSGRIQLGMVMIQQNRGVACDIPVPVHARSHYLLITYLPLLFYCSELIPYLLT